MVSDASRQWYERQKVRDQQSRELSESLLGPEKDIFLGAMGLMVSLFDAVLEPDKMRNLAEDLPFKRKVALFHYAFNLLWSAWDETLAGRYHTATDHRRSIDESSDFLEALEFSPQLAHQWTDTSSPSIDAARRAIKWGLDQAGVGGIKNLLRQMRDASQHLQALSHISTESMGWFLPRTQVDKKLVAVVRLGGAVSQIVLRYTAIPTTISALNLLSSATFAFHQILGTDDEFQIKLYRKTRAFMAALGKELDIVQADMPGPTTGIYFVRSDEEI